MLLVSITYFPATSFTYHNTLTKYTITPTTLRLVRGTGENPLLATVKRIKMIWSGHVARRTSLPKTILPDALEARHRPGRRSKSCVDGVVEGTLYRLYGAPQHPLTDGVAERRS